MKKAEIGDMKGRTVVITGTNTGIGRVTAVSLAEAGARVIMVNRSATRSEEVLAELSERGLSAELVTMDLGDLDSVRNATADIRTMVDSIDVLINNAGLAGSRGATRQGFEIAFGVNHLGHYLFTHELIEQVLAGDAPRIVHVASRAHYRGKLDDLDGLKASTPSSTGLPEYSESKLANVLFSAELATRYAGKLNSYSLHPGVVATDVWRSVPGPLAWLAKKFMIDVVDGAQTTLHCAASDAAAGETGLYYDNSRPKTPSAPARDKALATALWNKSAEWTNVKPAWAGQS
jgi:NAD(P)-dependent dehydrogenase (short-subunit alcohol dehydrogenase family)